MGKYASSLLLPFVTRALVVLNHRHSSGVTHICQRFERESRLLNPPPGSTDPERFATVSIGIGDRVLFHPAPREPRHERCEVSLRTEAGQFAGSDLPWPVRWVIRPPPPSHVISSPHGSSNTQATKLAACKTLGIPSLELDSGSQAVRKC